MAKIEPAPGPGVVYHRPVNSLGRCSIPQPIRTAANLKKDDYLLFSLESDNILIQKDNTAATGRNALPMECARRLDALGRITIPYPVRRALALKDGDFLSIVFLEDVIRMRRL